MRIFYIGTVEFSLKILVRLIEEKANIVGVATKKSSTFNTDYASLAPICKLHNIPCLLVEDINKPEVIRAIHSLSPEVIYCFGWSNLLKAGLLNLPPLGVVGYHPTLLPANRGRHPLIWALVLGLKETGSTFFFMDETADTGDIISQQKIKIDYNDDAASLYNKVINAAQLQVKQFTMELKEGTISRTKQSSKEGNAWRKRNIKDGIIDFRMSSRNIYNLIRGLSKPFVGASFYYNQQEIKVWKAKEISSPFTNCEPGKVLQVLDESVIIKCGDGAIMLLDHNFERLPQLGEYL